MKCPFSGMNVEDCLFYQTRFQQCWGGGCPIDEIAGSLCGITSILEKQEGIRIPIEHRKAEGEQMKCPFSGIDTEECEFYQEYNGCVGCPINNISESLRGIVTILLKKTGLEHPP